MQRLPVKNEVIRIVAIDPGTDTLGVSVLSLDLVTKETEILDSRTFKASKMLRINDYLKDQAELRGERFSRLELHRENLKSYLDKWTPAFVASESPFMGRRKANAYEALLECIVIIRKAVSDYDNELVVEMISPPSAKKIVGVTGKGKTKDDVAKGVSKFIANSKNKTTYKGLTPISKLDEHSIDSIAVGLYEAHHIYELYGVN